MINSIPIEHLCATLAHLEWTLGYDWASLSGGRPLQTDWLERATYWRAGRDDTPAWKTAMSNVQEPGWKTLQAAVQQMGLDSNFRISAAHCRDRHYSWRPGLEQRIVLKLDRDAKEAIHPVALAIRGYLDIIHIHPFNDGNTRAACIWLTWSLVRTGYDVPELGHIIRIPTPPANNRLPATLCGLVS